MNYRGRITNLKHPEKYLGDLSNIIYRSIWERNAIRWCDENPNVKEWGSEELAIPYDNPVLGRRAKYFPDLILVMTDGTTRIIEIKPKVQTQPPEPGKRKTKQYMNEVATWAINNEKWKAAKDLCERNSLQFEIWTEDTLKQMGIPTSATGVKKELREVKKPPMKTLVKKTTRPKRKS